MICWFEHGVTDSFGPQLAPMRLSRLPARQRVPALRRRGAAAPGLHASRRDGEVPAGIAADDDAGVHYVGTSSTRWSRRARVRRRTASQRTARSGSRRACALAPAPRAQLREPREAAQADPDRRQQRRRRRTSATPIAAHHIAQPPPRDRRLRLHVRARRPLPPAGSSTTRRIGAPSPRSRARRCRSPDSRAGGAASSACLELLVDLRQLRVPAVVRAQVAHACAADLRRAGRRRSSARRSSRGSISNSSCGGSMPLTIGTFAALWPR